MSKYLFYIFVFGFITKNFSQTITPQVINSAGGGGVVGSTGVEVYYNIGEPIITTIGNGVNFVTQGFLQPDIAGNFGLVATAFVSPNSCADKTDGSIKVTASMSGLTTQSAVNIFYYWSPSSVCPTNTCSTVDSLVAGTYSVMVIAQYTATSINIDTVSITNLVVSGSSEPCSVSIFNGISPNGDGNNDVFIIDNIDGFPNNRVEIYNRWGQKLFEASKYNNADVAWKGTIKNSAEIAPAGTYFYIIDLGNGSKPIKGWLELTTSK